MAIEIRNITPDELEAYIIADAYGFGDDPEAVMPVMALAKEAVEVERVLCAFDDGKIVGTVSAHSFEMSVQGGSLTLGAITNAFVFPTHRRQGLLTEMMSRQLREMHEREEPLSALTASESIIYGRFGFGIGIQAEIWSIERNKTAFANAPEWTGSTRFVDSSEVISAFPDIHRRGTKGRPGVVQPPLWEWNRIALDPPGPWRRGGTPYFYVVYEEDGRIDGYVIYRIRGDTVVVRELMGATDAANAALWRFCFDIDLRSKTEAINRPIDDPLYWMLADPRGLQRRKADHLWLRVVDVAAALSGRRYMTDDALVLEVKDTICPWNEGRFELEGGSDGAECRHTNKSADLVLSIADLSAAYLGTTRFTPLARAGRVEQITKGALLKADNMFAVERQPWCPFDF